VAQGVESLLSKFCGPESNPGATKMGLALFLLFLQYFQVIVIIHVWIFIVTTPIRLIFYNIYIAPIVSPPHPFPHLT
jgi:hypothetical protein